MASYLIGDIQGCNAALQLLLEEINYSPSRDTLYPLGDLVNRGEDSLGVLQTLMGFGDSVKCVLGNHDLHLFAVAAGVRPQSKHDTLQAILDAPSRSAMLQWLSAQALARDVQIDTRAGSKRWLLVHAGLLPQWSIDQTLVLAKEVETVLQSPDQVAFLQQMYGNTPNVWHDSLEGADRLRVIVNALTRLRFCTPSGEMKFATKESVGAAPMGYVPWFEAWTHVNGDLPSNTHIAFGHWSTLGLEAPNRVFEHKGFICLDTGAVWGGSLSAYELETKRLVQVKNPHPRSLI